MKNVILLLSIAGLIFFAYGWFTERYSIVPKVRMSPEKTATSTPESEPQASPTPTPPPTPEQQVASVFNKGVIDVTEIAAIHQLFPQLVTQELKYRLITVKGYAEKIMVTGLNNNKAEITIKTGTPLRVIITEDLSLKDSVPSRSQARNNQRWELVNRRLYLVDKNGGEPQHIVTQGEAIKPIRVRMDRISSVSMTFEIEPE